MQQIQQQLRRIGTLVGIGQYDSARIQLREGPTSGLRRTLRQTEEDFANVSDSVGAPQWLHRDPGCIETCGHSIRACGPSSAMLLV